MKQSKTPIWKKSILADLSLSQIYDHLCEINDNGDCFGYDRDEDGYYQDYTELFDKLAAGAYDLMEAMDETDLDEHWDDMTVALLGYRERVLGYRGDTFEQAEKRLIQTFKAGFVPYAMLYRDKDGVTDSEWRKFQREWCRPQIVGVKMREYGGERHA